MTSFQVALLGSVVWVLLFGWRLVAARRFLGRLASARRHLRAFRERAVPANGVVVDNQFESVPGRTELAPGLVLGGGGNLDYGVAQVQGPPGLLFHPIVEFTTDEGETVRFAAESASHRSWVPGQRVRVHYDPANPQDAEIPGERSVPVPVGAILRAVAHTALVLAGVLYGAPAAVAIAQGVPSGGDTPPELASTAQAMLAVAVACLGVGIVLRLVAAVVTPRWYKRFEG